MAMDDATRYSVLTAVIIILVAACIIGAFSCLDYVADKKFDDSRTQVSTLTQSDDGRTPRKRKVRIEGDDSSEASSLLDDGTQIKTDKALMNTFVKVLKNGITIKMHSGKDKAPKEVKLTLDEKNTLNWKSINSRSLIGAFKKNTMDIKNVKMVEWGKRTETFQKDMAASTPEELCLSLVGEDGATLDFEVTSKVERDSLAQGFTILIANLNDPSPDIEGG
jgi:hypothetical protein